MTAPALDLFGSTPAPKPLRPHQQTALAMLRQSLGRGNRRVVVQMPTGAGKTRTAAEIVNGALRKGNRVAFTVPAISLIDQTVEAFESEGIFEIGVIQSNHVRTDWSQPVQVTSVQSLANRARPLAEVVVVDECHVRFKAVSDWMAACPDTVFVGLSATPWKKGMAEDWQDLVVPVTMSELIEQKFLSPFRVFAPTHPDLSGVKTLAGDYHEGQLGEVMSDSRLVADIVETWLQRARGLPTLVFAVNRSHAAHIQQQFADRGVKMGYCDANTDLIERKFLFGQMRRGDIAGIVNVGTLTTGVDADVRCVVMARPTKSEILFVQCIGRGLRTAPGKDHCLILDHADNHARLGFVTDITHSTLLSGTDRKEPSASERGEPMPKECPACHALRKPVVSECPSCGFKPERKIGADIEVEDGELIEIKPGKAKHSKAAKQLFWSMALHVDKARFKQGRLAKALYKSKFGVWPRDLSNMTTAPDSAFMAYEHSRRIAYAKSKGRTR